MKQLNGRGEDELRTFSSRERMLLTLECREADYVPCCFMLFKILRDRCKDDFEFYERQIDMGLDVRVSLPSLPIRFHPGVKVREWRIEEPEERYPLLYKEYETPAGKLLTIVSKTEDWIHGEHVPFTSDYLIPRSKKFLVEEPKDIEPLRYLLTLPSDEEIGWLRDSLKRYKDYANIKGLLLSAGGGMGLEMASWLCGIEKLMMLMIEKPDFVDEIVSVIGEWNVKRMEVALEGGVDLFIRRGWYECAEFLSPTMFRRFVFPWLKREAELAHQAGAKFGYIMTTGTMPLMDIIIEAGVDVLIGVDPVQGRGTKLDVMKEKTKGKLCLWGGVNGYITIEMGKPGEVRDAVSEAIEVLAEKGGFILSPVDDLREDFKITWRNVEVFVEEWRRRRKVYARS